MTKPPNIDTHTMDSDFDREHLWHPYNTLPGQSQNFLVTSAKDCLLTLNNGRVLIDGMASWWSVIHGYNHPTINQALHQQIDRMSHVMFGGLTHQPAIELGKLLQAITPESLDFIFYADSGSVAVEVAMKMALQCFQNSQHQEKRKFLTVRGGYHGDTFAAMSVCDPVNGMHHLFADSLQQQYFAPAPQPGFHQTITADHTAELATLCEQHHHNIAAIILEPIVQGAGGMRFYSPDYLRKVRALCDEFNILLIADEIATGFGRTGKMFACEHADIAPDILCLGKALTGGYMSLAATLCNQRVLTAIQESDANVLMHGPTFMANPLACAAAIASIKLLLSQDWQTNIKRIEQQLATGLKPAKTLASVNDVRVLGAIGVIELNKTVDLAQVQALFVAQGVWVRPFGKLVYVMPPYVISDEQLQQLTHAMCHVVSTLT